ncbi:MAG: trypsin-like peptidase domain-containing protein [Bryobacterales bacterium]|nr:trypsin-like peptidase domain-containing protein [Bryobacterales bacterium]
MLHLLRVAAFSCSLVAAATPPWGATVLVEPGSAEAVRFSAVGRISNCTVFLIKPQGAQAASPAYVMTSGHCIDLGANDVIVDRADTSRTVQFGLLNKAAVAPLQVRSRRIVYSTMRGIDLAILELDSTLGALETAGIVPLVLARSVPQPATAVEWAGIPTGNVPIEERVLRTGLCETSGMADVLEWRWFWRGQIRIDCSDISGGASGSPLIVRATGMVTGIIGTTNVGNLEPGSDELCGRNDPCELRGAASTWVRNSSYATPAFPAAACFDAGVFQLTAMGCGLAPATAVRVLEQRLSVRPGASWNTTITSDSMRFFRYKVFPQGSGDCAEESGYSQPEPVPGRLSGLLPAPEGRYFACITAGVSPTPDSTWESPRFANLVHLRVDATPPAGPPRFNLSQSENGFSFVPGASLSTSLLPKADEAESSTCADLSTYRRLYPVPWFIPKGAVKRLCLVMEDAAGNTSPPVEIDLIEPAIFPMGVLTSAGYVHGRAVPGSWISVFGLNLAGAGQSAQVLLRAGGSEIELATAYASDGQINARLPDSTPLGPAEVIVAPPGRKPGSAPIRIEAAVPGIFTADARPNSFGLIFGIGADGSRQPTMVCAATGCTLHALEGFRDFAILAGGLGGTREVRVTFSEQPVGVLGVTPVIPGVDEIRVRLPAHLRLRGYLPVRVTAAGGESGPAWVWLR